jgi:hypothetical protein
MRPIAKPKSGMMLENESAGGVVIVIELKPTSPLIARGFSRALCTNRQ